MAQMETKKKLYSMNFLNLTNNRSLKLQKTLRYPIWCRSIGVHSGKICEVHLKPAPASTGITFVVDNGLSRSSPISATWRNSRPSAMRTTLVGNNGEELNTIEHLMSALSVCSIDNVEIIVHGNELPILDGSAHDWMFLLECAGYIEQSIPKTSIIITNTIRVENTHGWIEISPNDCFNVEYEINYDHPLIPVETFIINVTPKTYIKDIARARTFGFESDAIYIKKHGLAQGASLKNTVVFDKHSVMNVEGLRWSNEPVRHKILDMIGDLYLAGAPIIGKVRGYCSGHALNHKLVETLMTTPSAWRLSNA